MFLYDYFYGHKRETLIPVVKPKFNLLVEKVYTGKEFNDLTKECNFVRLTIEGEKHNGFQYQTGLNVDTEKFNPASEKGGLYFCEISQFCYFLEYISMLEKKRCKIMRQVTIPNDALVYVHPADIEDTFIMFKADKFILGEPKKIYDNHELSLAAVKFDGANVRFIETEKQSRDICLEACKQSVCAPLHIKNMTSELWLMSVTHHGSNLSRIHPEANRTPEICMAAVKSYGRVLEYVEDQTIEICLEACKQDGLALEFVKTQTPEICLMAVKQNGLALYWVKDKTNELCLEAVKQNGLALRYIEKQTEDVCLNAIKQNAHAIYHSKIFTREFIQKLLKR